MSRSNQPHAVTAWIGTAFRLVLAFVLLYAGVAKLFDFETSRQAVLAYRVLPVSMASGVAIGLPALEVLLGLALVLGFAVRWAAAATAVVMLAFIAGIVSVWVRGYSIDCGCFGGGGSVSPEGKDVRYTLEILRDTAFVLMAVWLIVRPVTRLAIPTARPAYSDPTDVDDQDQQGVLDHG